MSIKRLYGAHVQGVRRAIDIGFEREADKSVVVLQGQSGDGKSSTVIAIGFGLAGEVRTPELAKLNKDQIRNSQFNAVVQLEFIEALEDGSIDDLDLLRTLTTAGSHDLMIAGNKFKNLGAAQDHLEALFGCTSEQMGYLTSANRLVEMDGLEQGNLICGLMGPDITGAWLAEQVGELGGLLPEMDGGGWPMLEQALATVEAKRTAQGRDAKGFGGNVDRQQEVLEQYLRDARVPGAGNIGGALKAAEKNAEILRETLRTLQAQRSAAEEHKRALRDAEARLAVAEEKVADLRKQRNEADAVREEREVERAKLQAAVERTEGNLADSQETLTEAQRQFDDASRAASDGKRMLQQRPVLHACPHCKGEVGILDGELVSAGEMPEGQITEAQVEKLEAAEMNADTALGIAHEAVNAGRSALSEARANLDACPSVPPADELERKFDAAVAESDEALAKLEELRGKNVPAAPLDPQVEAVQSNLADTEAKLSALERAREANAELQQRIDARDAADATYSRYNALVGRLREVVKEVADEAIQPVLERSNTMLAPRLVLGYSADAGLVAVYGDEQRPIAELSSGERLMVGVTLQASIAIELEIGMCLVDDASVWDPATLRTMLEQMAAVGDEHWITWVVACAQPVPTDEVLDEETGEIVDVPMDGVQVVHVDGGYSE